MNNDTIKRAMDKINQIREDVDSLSYMNPPTPHCGLARLTRLTPKPPPIPRTTSEKKEK